ncbi:hypothetical protein B7G54_13800 [Burkholderia puraquae]|uniref:Lysine-specific metallo-endopeptidase domain-containing protein n=1 Tax=Burkholderia puraquae TaxID=1904757 RepID=A0A1X1PH21_9BURK|nr:PAAR domain-containing protein [Burkholderia puraquae]ORT85640.1 hypothetical protein B7G54_13800 [Burkholderia puraquae]CAB3766001.1 hypothetical protein LMG29660_05434 [Burkholderia puraquae]
MKNERQAPTHLFATVGALTERGGRVITATSGRTLAGLEVACVGDVVTYDDGSEAAIIDGAGNNHSGGKPFALVGSRLSNGDRIPETLRSSWGIHVRDGQSIAGLFDPIYVPPSAPPTYRLARDAAISLIQQRIAGVTTWNVAEQARARLYFGRADDDIRTTLEIGLPKLLNAMQELVPEKIVRWDDTMNKRLTCGVVPDSGSNTAAVCKPDSEKRIIAIYSKFCKISNGDLWTAAKVKTLIHECTHYIDTFNSDDIAYSDAESGLRIFAMSNPDSAIRNVDSITGYVATFDRKVME